MTREEEAELVRQRVEAGARYGAIAQELGVSRSTICRRYQPFRDEPSKFNRRLSDHERRRIESLLEQDRMTLRGIAREVQRSPSTVLGVRDSLYSDPSDAADLSREILFRRLRSPVRCETCRAKISTMPCPLCLARETPPATTPPAG